MPNQIETISLLPPDIQQNLVSLRGVINRFASELPTRFSPPRVYFPPPGLSNFQPVLRADCTNQGCGTRAVVHIKRDPRTREWEIVESKPVYDRINNSRCAECLVL